MKIENWNSISTTDTYPDGSLMIYQSLGEGAFGIIICTPNGEFFLEEIPLYGGDPRPSGKIDSIQHGIEIMKSWT